MSSFLCFLCHSTVNDETNEETREKYKEVVGIHLCPDSHLCYICCHVLHKLFMFRSICLKRSLEYPVLFSEKGTINLHRSDIEINILCPEECDQYHEKQYHYDYNNDFNTHFNDNRFNDNQYVELEDEFYYFNRNQYDIEKVTENYDCINEKPDDMLNDEHFHNFNQNLDYFKYNEEIPQINNLHVNRNNENIGFNYNDNRTNDYTNVFSQNTFDIPLDDYDNQIKHNIINQTYVEKENIVREKNNDLETCYSQETNININEKVGDDAKEQIVNDIIEQDNDCNDNEETNDVSTDDENQNILNTSDTTNTEDKCEIEIVKEINVKRRRKGFKRIVLSLEEQKKELECNRKSKKYMEAEFKCYNCAIGFLFKDTYQAHMMRHEESNGEFRCVTCTLRFSTHALLRTHKKSHTDIYECLDCGHVLKPRAKRTHPCFQTKHDENVSCHLCGNLFRDANGLQQHLRRVHAKASNRLHSCTICNENFTNPSVLKTHMIKHINRKFQCEKCPAVYKSPYTLAQHMKRHQVFGEKYGCTLCDVVFDSRKSLLAHYRRTAAHQNTVLECSICSRVFATQSSLDAHAQTHTSAQYQCTHCTHTYTTRKSLIRHMRRHTGQELVSPAVCHLCGNTFKGKNKLNRHLKQVCEKSKLEEQLASIYD